jgi:2-amino-4-hydroxy-6-hydroxymethyldihydropteridine diphosphokinase
MRTTYLISLGSNRRHPRYGSPRGVIKAAMARLPALAWSRIIFTAPIGPSHRRFANAAALIQTILSPPELLDWLKAIETEFGRRSTGQRWSARVLDLDIILWSGGIWADDRLIIPHRLWTERRFVIEPLCEVAPHWRDPLKRLSVRQHKARLDRKRRAS